MPASPFCCVRPNLLLVLSALLFAREGLSQDAAEKSTFEELSPEALTRFLSIELLNEENRAAEPLFRFNEFQEVADMDCPSRLFYLMNTTITTRNAIIEFHNDVLGISGVFVQLLRHLPQENSWVWLLASAYERLLKKVQTYWARIVALSLDQHHCLPPVARNALIDGVVRWKQLHGEYSTILWFGFAFGSVTDVVSLADRNKQTPQSSTSTPVAEQMMAGNVWLSDVRNSFEDLTQKLYKALQEIEMQAIASQGPTRLHHQDEQGSFVTYEFLRRKVFKQWAIDKGLLRGLIRSVWKPSFDKSNLISVADFGAGGGHYSSWLNETGLVKAFAFDGTHEAAKLTDGVVQEVNLVEAMSLWRTFDWILCLEVGEHVPKQYSDTLLQNLKHHAKKGLVMSWSDDWEGIGHVNCLSRDDFVATVQAKTGFILDHEATEVVRSQCEIDYIARTLAVFRAATS